MTTDAKRRVDITDITSGQEVVFSYTVEWVHTPEISYDDRMKRYAGYPDLKVKVNFHTYIMHINVHIHTYIVDSTFLPTTFEIHWLSVVNSIVLVLLLMFFLAIILMRILKNDFSKYMEIDEEELTEEVS